MRQSNQSPPIIFYI